MRRRWRKQGALRQSILLTPQRLLSRSRPYTASQAFDPHRGTWGSSFRANDATSPYAHTAPSLEGPPATSPQALRSALFSLVQQEHLRKLAKQAPVQQQGAEEAAAGVPATDGSVQIKDKRPSQRVTPHSGQDARRNGPTSVSTNDGTLLTRLLSRKRETQRRQRQQQQQSASSLGLGTHHSGQSMTTALRERLIGARLTEQTTPHDTSTGTATTRPLTHPSHHTTDGATGATWHTAFRLFSEAVHDNAVTPTAQHFNLLLGLVIQEGLWAQADRVEDFYARFLASTQELRAEKERALSELLQRSTSDIPDTLATPQADESPVNAADITPTVHHVHEGALELLERQRQLHHEVTELAVMEGSLRPNRQTFDLLMRAALCRGAWQRVLEYAENTRDAGLVIKDEQVRMVLEACLMGGARTMLTPESIEEARKEDREQNASLGIRRTGELGRHPHGTYQGRTRLLTNQRGAALDAAARPPLRSTRQRTRQATSDTAALPLWRVGLSYFDAHRHAVTSPKTVWLAMRLVSSQIGDAPSGGTMGSRPLLLRVYADAEHILPCDVVSAAGTREDVEAVMKAHEAASAAAREIGDWPLALRLWRNAAQSWHLHYVLSLPANTDTSAWGTPVANGADALAEQHAHGESLQPTTEEQVAWLRKAVRLHAQQLLVNALHTLRRVRRYQDILSLYKDAASFRRPGASGPDTLALWTPRALTFVAQAAMAEGKLSVLLHLAGVDKGRGEAGSADLWGLEPLSSPSVEVFDAALQSIQRELIKTEMLSGTTGEAAATTSAQASLLHDMARNVYKVFLDTAVAEACAVSRFEKTDTDVRDVLTTVHAPLVALWQRLQQCRGGDGDVMEVAEEALTHLRHVRRADAVALTLTVGIVQGAAERVGDRANGQSSSTAHSTRVETDLLTVFSDLVKRAEENATAATRRPTEEMHDEHMRHVQRSLSLVVVSAACVDLAVDALCLLGQPFMALALLEWAATYHWLPTAHMAHVQVRVRHEVVRSAQRAAAKTEADSVAADEVASLNGYRLSFPAPDDKNQVGSQIEDTTHGAVEALASLAALSAAAEHEHVADSPAARSTAHLCRSLVADAVDVVRELQASGQHRPPTASVTALVERLHRVVADEALGETLLASPNARGQLDVTTVVIVNAVLQQVSVVPMSRWSLWPQCARLLTLLAPPLAEITRGNGAKPLPTEATIKVLGGLVRYCDKAERGLVESIALEWLVRADHCPPRRENEEKATSALNDDRDHVRVGAQSLLLDCVTWACRRREKPLVRALLKQPLVAALLYADPRTITSSARQDALTSTLTAVLQCLSSGEHRATLGDWAFLSRTLGSLHAHCVALLHVARPGYMEAAENVRCVRLPSLLDGVAAVFGKLERSLCYLLKSASFDAHRQAQAAPPSPPSPPCDNVLALEHAVDEFLSIAEEFFLSDVLAGALLGWEAVGTDGENQSRRRELILLRTALSNALDAAWHVLWTQFVWTQVFRPQATSVTCVTYERMRQRARSLMLVEVSFADPHHKQGRPSFPPQHQGCRKRHLRMWVIMQSTLLGASLDAGHTPSVTALCADVTTLETLQGIHHAGWRRPQTSLPVTGVSRPSGSLGQTLITLAEPQSGMGTTPGVLLSVLLIIDELSSELLATQSKLRHEKDGQNSKPESALPPVADGRTHPGDLFSSDVALLDPLVRGTTEHPHAQPLSVLHETGLQLLYVALCEGNESLLRNHPDLVRRVLGWPLTSSLSLVSKERYQRTLHALEAVGLPTLRSSSSVAEVLHGMAAFVSWWMPRRAPSRYAEGNCLTRHAEQLLSFLQTSRSFRGGASLDSNVAAEAILCFAAAAAAREGDGAQETEHGSFVVPPRIVSLLSAFPLLTLKALLPRWMAGDMTTCQKESLDGWMTHFLASSTSRPLTSLNSLTLRRHAVTWFLGTTGSLAVTKPCTEDTAPSTFPDAARAAVRLAAEGEQAFLTLLSPSPEALLEHHRNLQRHHRGRRQFTVRNSSLARLLRKYPSIPRSSLEKAKGQNTPHPSFGAKGASAEATDRVQSVMKDTLTRSSAEHLLAMCFPADVTLTEEKAPASASAPSHLPVFAEAELHTLLALSGPRMSDGVKQSVLAANTLRRTEQAVLRELEAAAACQRVGTECSEAVAPVHLLRTEREHGEKADTLIKALFASIARATKEERVASKVLAAVAGTAAAMGPSESPITNLKEASVWLQRHALLFSCQANGVEESLHTIEGFLVRSLPTKGEDDGLAALLVLLLAVTGPRATVAQRCLEHLYPLVRTPIWDVLLPQGPAVAMEVGVMTQATIRWHQCVESLLFAVSALSSGGEQSGAGGQAGNRDEASTETAFLAFGLRRALSELHTAALLFPAGAHVLPDRLGVLAQDTMRLLEDKVEEALGAALGPSPDLDLDKREVVRAWVQSSVLLGAWRPLSFLARKLKQRQTLSDASYSDLGLSLSLAKVVASLAHPSSPHRASNDKSELGVTLAESEMLTGLEGYLKAEAARAGSHFSKLAHRQPTYCERIILSDTLRSVSCLLMAGTSSGAGRRTASYFLRDATVRHLYQTAKHPRKLFLADATTSPSQVPALSVEDAVTVLMHASPREYAAFVTRESLYRRPGSRTTFPAGGAHADGGGAPRNLTAGAGDGGDNGKRVQQAWKIFMGEIEKGSCTISPETAKAVFLRLQHVPHTKHFIPMALSEVLFLQACDTIEEALTLVAFSVSTLTRSHHVATAVQQYMVYLLLKRSRLGGYTGRHSSQLSPFRNPAPRQVPPHRDESATRSRVVRRCYELLTRSMDVDKASPETAPTFPQFLSAELLRASVCDANLTLLLYKHFWWQRYPRLEGVNVFLSLLRAAREHRREDLALRAMHDFLLLLLTATPSLASPAPPSARSSARSDGVGIGDKSIRDEFVTSAITSVVHRVTEENRQIVWKAFASLCRMAIVTEPHAKRIVAAFRQPGNGHAPLVSDVEELLVMAGYHHHVGSGASKPRAG